MVAALFVPVLYEVWRMAYFAMIEPNTGLAKAGTSSWWNQGFTYLWNFIAPYTMWLPFLLVVALMSPQCLRWWRGGDRLAVAVLLTPVVAGTLDWLWVVYVGGDYMHARLLLPGFFAFCIAPFVPTGSLRSLLAVPAIGVVVWSVVAGGWLRFDASHAFFDQEHGISNARDFWIANLDNGHPITPADWSRWSVPALGYAHSAAVNRSSGRQEVIVVGLVGGSGVLHLGGTLSDVYVGNAVTALPVHAVVNISQIGSEGLASGPDVYVFDTQSLANPIGAHTEVTAHPGRPGGKTIDPLWMVARFGAPGQPVPVAVASPADVAAARAALGCGQLRTYLHDITAPLTPGQMLSNVGSALSNTTFRFSSDPEVAERQLCGHGNTSRDAP